jgi:hypothetical protein
MNITAGDTDIAQGLITEILQLASRTCSPPPFDELAFDVVPTPMHLEIAWDHAHGWLRRLTRPEFRHVSLCLKRGM